MKRCPCGRVYYCSETCQLKDWEAGHMQACPYSESACDPLDIARVITEAKVSRSRAVTALTQSGQQVDVAVRALRDGMD